MLPRLPIGDKSSATPTQVERMKALSTARSEMEAIVANLRVKTAISHNLPPSLLDMKVFSGMLVLVYRKNSQMWEGPFELDNIEGKTAYVRMQNNRLQPFSVTRVKPYLISSLDTLEENLKDTEETHPTDNRTDLGEVLYHKILSPKDVTEEAILQFQDAINAEMEGLFQRKAFAKTPISELPMDANIRNSRFVLSVKNVGTSSEKLKARLVAMGHTDREKDYIISDAPTLMRYAMRSLLALASSLKLKIYSRDVRQAYLQSNDDFKRQVYIRIPKGYDNIPPHFVLQVLKPLYGLTESGSYWIETYLNFFLLDMKMSPFLLDPCFMYKKKDKKVVGVVGIIVDDTIAAGTDSFIS